MKEIIARAIGEGIDIADPMVGDVVDEQDLLAAADAVLAAMREPTKAMIEAGIRTAEDCKESDWDSGGDGEQHNSYEYFRSDAPATIFTAMIDAARAPSS